jgi:hypothetical protein
VLPNFEADDVTATDAEFAAGCVASAERQRNAAARARKHARTLRRIVAEIAAGECASDTARTWSRLDASATALERSAGAAERHAKRLEAAARKLEKARVGAVVISS